MIVQLNEIQTTAPCPDCGYEVFLLLSELAAQTYLRCPCCRVLVHLLDADASTHTAARDIDKALRGAADDLARAFQKGIG